MTNHLEKSEIDNTQVPYPHSWIDRLIMWIGHIPGPAWILYALGVLGIAVFVNAIFWIDGSIPVGSINLSNTGYSFFIMYWLWLYQYLSSVGSRSLKGFRPLLVADDSEIDRINHELVILPRWIGWLAILLGLGLTAAMIIGDPEPYGDIVPRTAIPYVGDFVITSFMLSTFICLAIRSVRQLRLVRKLHARATNVNLLKLDPAHAFSALSSRTGIGIIFVIIISYPLDSSPFSSPLELFLAGVTLLLAIGVFVLPIIGIRNQLDDEKKRVLDEINDLLRVTSERLHNRVREDNYQAIGQAKDAMEALTRERELIGKISTWPWDSSTLRVFASALLLPIFLHLVTRLLEGFLSF